MSIADNINLIKENIAQAARESGRNPEDIILVCVTKQISVERIFEAVSAGIEDIGESRVGEVIVKKNNISEKIKVHMIGHLQSRKAKDAVKIFDLIHSVDSVGLAQEINKRAAEINKTQDILIEVNVSGEESKYGLKKEDIFRAVEEISKLENVKVLGLMTMAPLSDDAEVVRPVFRELKQLFDEIKRQNIKNIEMKYLSMGMTQDYLIAIEEGANMVRIGTAIFGGRL